MSEKRAKNVMYEQQLARLPATIKRKTLASIIKALTDILKPEKIAGIIHDKDHSENDPSQLAKSHAQVMMQFGNPRSLNNLAKLMREPTSQPFTAWKGNVNNGYSYLIHRTDDAKGKYQYSVEDVKANFDYSALIEQIEEKVKTKNKIKDSEIISALLDQFGDKEITKEEILERLTGSQYTKAKKGIEDIEALLQEEDAKAWLKERKESGQPLKVLWLYGTSGVGKTALAKQYAQKLGENYYITGSSRDPFQFYQGEHVVIIDEFRPYGKYDDLLKMLDPYAESPRAPSRYHDKTLAVDTYIITSPMSPKQYYDTLFEWGNQTVDSFQQLDRRLALVQQVTKESIEAEIYDEKERIYRPLPKSKLENTLLKQLQKEKKQDLAPDTLFKELNTEPKETRGTTIDSKTDE